MNILHTSDWHLGKYLEHASRITEQQQFLEQLNEICEQKQIDIVIIAGDIFDTKNPPSVAEDLFYKSINQLSNDGQRLIIIVAGNHDNPKRLKAISHLATKQGIIIVGYPNEIIEKNSYSNYCITHSDHGVFVISFKGEQLVFVTMPYPSEKTLKEVFKEEEEEDIQKAFSKKVGTLMKKSSNYFTDESINIIIGHFFVVGGDESSSEREIQLGGSYAVHKNEFPKADYIAMGHLHKPQKMKNIYYSGSPLQYSVSEVAYAKAVNIVTIKNKNVNVEKYILKNYKPIEIWNVKTIEDAINMSKEKALENSYVYINIDEKSSLTFSQIKEIKSYKKDILDIKVLQQEEEKTEEIYREKSIKEEFSDFYKKQYGKEASEDIINMFLNMTEE